jgi:hypothetical protein
MAKIEKEQRNIIMNVFRKSEKDVTGTWGKSQNNAQ